VTQRSAVQRSAVQCTAAQGSGLLFGCGREAKAVRGPGGPCWASSLLCRLRPLTIWAAAAVRDAKLRACQPGAHQRPSRHMQAPRHQQPSRAPLRGPRSARAASGSWLAPSAVAGSGLWEPSTSAAAPQQQQAAVSVSSLRLELGLGAGAALQRHMPPWFGLPTAFVSSSCAPLCAVCGALHQPASASLPP
jgi:hypothetical protein